MVQWDPTDIGRGAGIAAGDPDHLEIGLQVGVADLHSLGGGGRSGGVLQKGGVIAPQTGQGRPSEGPRLRCRVDGEPIKAGSGEVADKIAAVTRDQCIGSDSEARRTVGNDAGARIAGALPARQHHRHGNDPGQNAAEKSDHKFDAGRTQQQCPLSRGGTRRDPLGQRCGALFEFSEIYRGLLAPPVGEHKVGTVVRLCHRAVMEQIGERRQPRRRKRIAISRCRHSRRPVGLRHNVPDRRSSDDRKQPPDRVRCRAIPPVRR